MQFMSKDELKPEESKNDHRAIGEALDLFSFHEVAPGTAFWHGKGMIIFRELEKLIRGELDQVGYEEISTPIMVKKEVFEKSGHAKYYRENMFELEDGDQTYFLKPMNCPESTYVYGSRIRSYKDLPLRLSEIGRLHRNELSGVLGGLFRARQFTMDDAHIYLRPDQIQGEVSSLLKLVTKVYAIFGFSPKFYLSTMPDKAMGDKKAWEKAEEALEMALKENGVKHELKEKDGAFYGPKIDIEIKDSLGRSWQLATIQLDLLMLPEQFGLTYIDEEGKKQKPMVIHRAVYGSFERFIGVLLEHFEGALPLWLSPVQAVVLPVSEKFTGYGKKVFDELKNAGIRVEISDANETLGKRIREAEVRKIPYVIVVGEREESGDFVNVRRRGSKDNTEVKVSELISRIKKEIEERAL
ncbi:MAG: threonyl-tRNA synthetase [Parcubacteria group bacterium Gr01-1014_20]|nr:MAG: threonyl-tRNA synthetase [Parcubacteria group bacterium Gr01-1014_20]